MPKGPRLSVGQAATAWACQRHAARLLDPEQTRPRVADGTFRLSNAISVAIVDAHRQFEDLGRPRDGLIDLLEAATPPPELGHEEAARFATAIDAYVDAFGNDAHARAVCLHAKSETPLEVPLGDCGAMLTGRVSLAFSNEPGSPHAGSVTIRSITVGPVGGEGDQRADALRLAALGATEGSVERLTVTPTGSATLATHTYTHDQIRSAWRSAGEMVDAALAAGEGAPATPGWWCTSCAFVRNCPAVSSQRFIDVVDAYPSQVNS
jgi:hypothetical protein